MAKRVLALCLGLFMLLPVIAGCTPAKKPAPAPAPRSAPKAVPRTMPRTNMNKMPTTPAEVNKLADKLAKEAAKVKGVKKATVVISGTNAYVGIDMAPNIEASKSNTVKKEVAGRVKKADKRLTDVYVTSDVGVVTRIKKVAQGIAAGKPISSFANEIAEIGRRIVPNRK